MKIKKKQKIKFNECINHSEHGAIPANLVLERNLDQPMGRVLFYTPKFDW